MRAQMSKPVSKTSALAFNLILAFVAFSLEVFFLHAILFHPAAGRDVSASLVMEFLVFASLPFIASLVIYIVGTSSYWAGFLQNDLVVISIIGVVFCFIALRQYSHATPGLLMLGYAIQWIMVIRQAFVVFR
jgi:hypothetical protein